MDMDFPWYTSILLASLSFAYFLIYISAPCVNTLFLNLSLAPAFWSSVYSLKIDY